MVRLMLIVAVVRSVIIWQIPLFGFGEGLVDISAGYIGATPIMYVPLGISDTIIRSGYNLDIMNYLS